MIKPADLITPQYRELQRQLHASPRGYGQKGRKWAPAVVRLVELYGATSVLDYGCGQGSLKVELKKHLSPAVRIDEYDPAIAGKDGIPEFADLVVCTDVLEHIEPDKLDNVLAHLKLLARQAVFMVVNLRPASKVLADGRNAHLIVESAEWWRRRVEAAGLKVRDRTVPFPPGLTPEKQSKCWVAVVEPA